MSRGMGIIDNLPVKYAFVKQPNGNYTILDVPFFRFYEDDKPPSEGGRGKVGAEEARAILANFEEDKKTGSYPRVHIEHQEDDMSNKPGIGYLDNMRLAGEIFFADLVEIPSLYIRPGQVLGYERINKDGKKTVFELPGRSVEYNAERQKITGLALLDSQPSYFVFPILCLADGPAAASGVQAFQMAQREKILRFAMGEEKKSYCFGCAKFCGCDKKSDTMTFCKDRKGSEGDMEEKKKFADDGAPAPVAAEPQEKPAAPSGEEAPPWARELVDSVKVMRTVLEKLVQTDSEVHENAEPDGDEDATGNEPPGQEESPIAKPNSVAMQQQINALQRQVFQLQGRQSLGDYEADLRAVCEENPAINFERARTTLNKFQSDADRRLYLEDLRASTVSFQEHEATRFAVNYKSAERGSTMQKFTDKPMPLQKIAREAFQMWADTARHPNPDVARKFVKLHPDQQKFVEHCVEMEESTPGYFKKLAL